MYVKWCRLHHIKSKNTPMVNIEVAASLRYVHRTRKYILTAESNSAVKYNRRTAHTGPRLCAELRSIEFCEGLSLCKADARSAPSRETRFRLLTDSGKYQLKAVITITTSFNETMALILPEDSSDLEEAFVHSKTQESTPTSSLG